MLVPAALDDLDVDDKSSFFTTVDAVVSSTFIEPLSLFVAAANGMLRDEELPTVDKFAGFSVGVFDEQEREVSRWCTR